MTINNALGTVTLQYKADTSDAERNLNRLSAVQKKNAKDAVDAQQDVSASLSDYMTKIGLAAGAVTAGIAIAKASFAEYSRTIALEGAVSASTLDAVTRASDGLKTKMELLTLAQAAEQGAFKLTARETEAVVKGMRALETQGYKSEVVTQKITKAIQEGAVPQLQEFGIELKSTGTIAGDKALILAALAKEVKDVGGNFASAGDDVTRAGVKWEDTLHGVKMAIGEMVVQMGPMIAGLASIVQLAAQIASYANAMGNAVPGGGGGGPSLNGLPGFAKWLSPLGVGGQAAIALGSYGFSGNGGPASGSGTLFMSPDQQSAWDAKQAGWAADGSMNNDSPRIRAMMEQQQLQRRQMAQALAVIQGRAGWLGAGIGKGLGIGEKAARPGRRGRGPAVDEWSLVDEAGYRLDEFTRFADKQEGISPNGPLASLGRALGGGLGGLGGDAFDSLKASKDALGASLGQWEEGADEGPSWMEKTFGTLEEFDAYKSAFEGLTGALSAGFEAWITGSKSAGEAIKQALAAYAKNLAIEAFLRAATETAKAISSAASYNYPEAAGHAAAAAKWAAIAVAAGVVAKVAGGGGATSGGAGGFRGRSMDHTDSGPRVSYAIIGDTASDGGPRRRAREQRRLTTIADKYAPPTGSNHG